MPAPKDPIAYALWKQRLSESLRGDKSPLYGKPRTDEQKQKQREAMKGRRLSEEHRKKISETNKGERNGFYGKHHSEETRKKLSKPKSIEHRKKLSAPKSEETRRKLSISKTGVRLSQLTREKMCLARIQRQGGGIWYGSVKYYDYIGPQYCEKWTPELRERVRAFFGYKCVECGEPQNGKKLDVHHVYYNKKACCDDTPRALVALCHSCHTKTTAGNRSYWIEHFQEIIDTEYDGRCWLTKEEYRDFLEHKPLSSPALMN